MNPKPHVKILNTPLESFPKDVLDLFAHLQAGLGDYLETEAQLPNKFTREKGMHDPDPDLFPPLATLPSNKDSPSEE